MLQCASAVCRPLTLWMALFPFVSLNTQTWTATYPDTFLVRTKRSRVPFSGGGRHFRVGGGGDQFARSPESARTPLGAEGPLFLAGPIERMKDLRPLPLRIKKSYQMGPLIVPKRTLSYRGSPEFMAQSSKHVRGSL